MLFNSFQFLLFFPTIIIIYFLIPVKYRWILLLAGSYYFYMCWKVEYIFLILFSTIIDYVVGLQMGRTQIRKKRRFLLMISLFTNLGLLFAFKYFNFFNESFRELFHHFDMSYSVPAIDVLLPVGISFYTFQTLSYSIDVYRGAKEPEKHFGIFALYVSFFPQLVAGPIERSSRLLPQLNNLPKFEYSNVVEGLKRMLWGFFKKVVIADRLAIYVTSVYNNQEHHNGTSLLLATFFFTFQVYCDFSAYSDIAIGAARVMGVDLMENFKRPFMAKSVNELWRRWHISLTTWFRDYLYIPLGGNRVVRWRWYINIMIVFVVSGLWHGAAWTFVIFGFLQGVFLIVPLIFRDTWSWLSKSKFAVSLPSIYSAGNILLSFVLFSFSLFVFRSLSMSDAVDIFIKFFNDWGPVYVGDDSTFVYSIFFILMLIVIELEQEFKITKINLFNNHNYLVRNFSYAALVIIILLFGVFDGGQFIYFQF